MAQQSVPAAEPTQAAQTQPEVPTSFPGQLGMKEILAIFRANQVSRSAARAEYLKDHPHYIPCSVSGCEGLVGPNYQRVTPDNQPYGFCPRRRVHARLMPSVFGQ